MTQHPYTYDRDCVVAAVRDFYNFLSRIPRWTAADFWDAPPGGWRELTDEALAPLGKTAAVNDLLRHLPYVMPVREPGDDIDEDGISGAGSSGDKMCVAPETQAIDYPHRYTLDALAEGSIDGIVSPYGAGSIPAHVAVLTSGHKHGSWLLVDTQEGTATDFVMFERPQRPEPALGSPDYWRAYQTLPVGEMLAEWKAKFLQLEWVVVPDDYEDGVMYRMDEETDVRINLQTASTGQRPLSADRR